MSRMQNMAEFIVLVTRKLEVFKIFESEVVIHEVCDSVFLHIV